MMNKNDLTVIVAKYNQDLDKVLITLNSIILQRNVSVKIIVADDGSKENNFTEIKEFFTKKNYENYELLTSEKNQGTVKNFYRCMSKCDSEFTKFISPGDFFSNESVLQNWIIYMREKDFEVSFSDAIYYSVENNTYKIENVMTKPKDLSVYKNEKRNKIFRNVLLYDDLWLGAAVLCKSDILKKYMDMIIHDVNFAEDNIYRIMICDNIKFGYFDEKTIYYECNTGISSNTEKVTKWRKIIMEDWMNTNHIIKEKIKKESIKKKFVRIVEWKYNSNVKRDVNSFNQYIRLIRQLFKLYMIAPSALFWHLKVFGFSKKSEGVLVEDWIAMIREI